MSRRRVYSKSTLAIMERFWTAIEECHDRKLIPSYTDFCNANNINLPHFYTQRKYPYRGFFEVGWIAYLVEHCGVSANWLLTGKGVMFL